jgi:hypothetical protein
LKEVLGCGLQKKDLVVVVTVVGQVATFFADKLAVQAAERNKLFMMVGTLANATVRLLIVLRLLHRFVGVGLSFDSLIFILELKCLVNPLLIIESELWKTFDFFSNDSLLILHLGDHRIVRSRRCLDKSWNPILSKLVVFRRRHVCFAIILCSIFVYLLVYVRVKLKDVPSLYLLLLLH